MNVEANTLLNDTTFAVPEKSSDPLRGDTLQSNTDKGEKMEDKSEKGFTDMEQSTDLMLKNSLDVSFDMLDDVVMNDLSGETNKNGKTDSPPMTNDVVMEDISGDGNNGDCASTRVQARIEGRAKKEDSTSCIVETFSSNTKEDISAENGKDRKDCKTSSFIRKMEIGIGINKMAKTTAQEGPSDVKLSLNETGLGTDAKLNHVALDGDNGGSDAKTSTATEMKCKKAISTMLNGEMLFDNKLTELQKTKGIVSDTKTGNGASSDKVSKAEYLSLRNDELPAFEKNDLVIEGIDRELAGSGQIMVPCNEDNFAIVSDQNDPEEIMRDELHPEAVPVVLGVGGAIAEIHRISEEVLKLISNSAHNEDAAINEDPSVEAVKHLERRLRSSLDRLSNEEYMSAVNAADPALLPAFKDIQTNGRKQADMLLEICDVMSNDRLGGFNKQADVTSFAEQVLNFLTQLRPVNLDKLIQLLEENSKAGEYIEGRDILLLLGATGTGKTSTMLYLAGTTFEEIEVDGSDHMKPTSFPSSHMSDFHTSHGAQSVTQAIQCTEIPLPLKPEGQTVLVCDSPGLEDTNGVEIEISNGCGIVDAISRAKTVRPVVVFSKESMGSRFTGMTRTIETVSKLFPALVDNSEDPTFKIDAFSYLFTQYEPKFKTRLSMQFNKKIEQMSKVERSDPLFTALLKDLRDKTKPEALIVNLLEEEERLPLLTALMRGKSIENPRQSVSHFIPASALDRLHLQMGRTLDEFESALNKNHVQLALHAGSQLFKISSLVTGMALYKEKQMKVILRTFGNFNDSLKLCAKKILERRPLNGSASDGSIDSFFHVANQCIELDPLRMKFDEDREEFSVTCTSICMKLGQTLAEQVLLANWQCGDGPSSEQFADAVQVLKKLRLLWAAAEASPRMCNASWECKRFYREASKRLVFVTTSAIEKARRSGENREAFDVRSFTRRILRIREQLEYLSLEVSLKQDVKSAQEDCSTLLAEIEAKIEVAVDGVSLLSEHVKNAHTLSKLLQIDVGLVENAIYWLHEQDWSDECFVLLKRFSHAWLERENARLQSNVEFLCQAIVSMVERASVDIRLVWNEGKTQEFDSFVEECVESLQVIKQIRSQSLVISEMTDVSYRKLAALYSELINHVEETGDIPTAVKRDAVHQAKTMLRHLEDLKLVLVLPELTSNWARWMEVLKRSKKKPMTMVWRALKSYVGFAAEGEQREDIERAALLETANKIQYQLVQQITSTCCEMQNVFLYDFGFDEILADWCFDLVGAYLSVAFLVASGSALQSDVFGSEERRFKCRVNFNHFMDATKAAVNFFSGWKELQCALIARKDFATMEKVLRMMESKKDFFVQARKYSALEISTSAGQIQSELQRVIAEIDPFDSFRRKAFSAAYSLKNTLTAASFTKDVRARSVNEEEQQSFYEELSVLYGKSLQVQCIAQFDDSKNNKEDLSQLSIDAVRCFRSETMAISSALEELLDSFPCHSSTFSEIHILLVNLRSIKDIFQSRLQEVSGLAYSSIEKAQSKFEQKLEASRDHIESMIDPEDCKKAIQQIMLLKRASFDIPFWSTSINATIANILDAGMGSSSQGEFLLAAGLYLRRLEGNDAPIALQLLSEHDCFKGAMNALFNSKTARQDIHYVLSALKPKLTESESDILKVLYLSFQKEYDAFILDSLGPAHDDTLQGTKDPLSLLVDGAWEVAKDLSVPYRSQVSSLVAHTFAFWSLQSATKEMVQNKTFSSGNTSLDWMMKPHCAQVVAILLFLNVLNGSSEELTHHVIQILTGEGKSVVLGITATILAMLGYDVKCVCYSKYLSSRDEKAFCELFQRFGVDRFVSYKCIGRACNDIANEDGNIRTLVESFIRNGSSDKTKKYKNGGHSRAKVLLVDEIDVLFHRELLGKTYQPVCAIQDFRISNLLRLIWDMRDTSELVTLDHPCAVKCLQMFRDDIRPIVRQEIQEMTSDVRYWDSQAYSIVEGRIGFKHFDGMKTNCHYGYRTIYQYLHEVAQGNISEHTMMGEMGWRQKCGDISYAELPNQFDVVLGLTGTLEGLCTEQQIFLKDAYGISTFTHLPSVYGSNNLQFSENNASDLIICESECYHLEIRREIDRRLSSQHPNNTHGVERAVMVFFETSEDLLDFSHSTVMNDIKLRVRCITETIRPSEKESAFLKATSSGAITLMIRDYGRGTDFKCFDEGLINSGGVHVIQTFLSSELTEEMQIKGRTARQGAKGSYSMVLDADKLCDDFGFTNAEIEDIKKSGKLYSSLAQRRDKLYKQTCSSLMERVNAAEKKHYEFLDFRSFLLDGNEKQALRSLYRLSGLAPNLCPSLLSCEESQNCPSLHNREAFVKERKERYAKYLEARRLAREKAWTDFDGEYLRLTDGCTPNNTTHHGLLGVPLDASNKDIERAFRKMARKFHPDHNKHLDNDELFKMLNEAREVLLDPSRRAAYERDLDSKKSSEKKN